MPDRWDVSRNPLINVVTTFIVRKHATEGVQVLTQTRNVLNKDYDPLYHGTEEAAGETFEPDNDRTVFDCLLRACTEELGAPNFQYERMIGGTIQVQSSRPEDEVEVVEPYLTTHMLRGSQRWLSMNFVFLVAPDFEPKISDDGEVSGFTWWSPHDLMAALEQNPKRFCGLDTPAFKKLAEDLIQWRLNV